MLQDPRTASLADHQMQRLFGIEIDWPCLPYLSRAKFWGPAGRNGLQARRKKNNFTTNMHKMEQSKSEPPSMLLELSTNSLSGGPTGVATSFSSLSAYEYKH